MSGTDGALWEARRAVRDRIFWRFSRVHLPRTATCLALTGFPKHVHPAGTVRGGYG
jgi:hypothetical protein